MARGRRGLRRRRELVRPRLLRRRARDRGRALSLRVLHVARECAPLAKAGGLADVVGALPAATAARPGGPEVAVLMPAYDALRDVAGTTLLEGRVRVGGERLAYRVREASAAAATAPVLLVEHACFAGPAPYGGDELAREAVLSAAALEVGRQWDLVHVHDHHASLATIGLATHPAPRPTVLTVHNARYHGALAWEDARRLDLPASLEIGACDHDGRFNRLKGALLHSAAATTVSPTHASDLLEKPEASLGLAYAFREASRRFCGILNGIDREAWDPATDPLLTSHHSADDLSGKAEGKRHLCAELGLDPGDPLFAFVGRLVPEKGVDALVDGLPRLLELEPRAQAALLGRGEPRYESALVALQARHAPRVAVAAVQDERFAHRLYAAADALLMPSWHEPCGLSQMYAMRYGTVPVVFPTGGLRDSVVPWDPATGRGTGAWMATPDADGLVEASRRVLAWMRDERAWARLRDNGMRADHGWAAAAAHYVATYRRALEAR